MKSAKTRYDDAVEYINRVDVALSDDVKQWTRGRESQVGGKFSLGGKSWHPDEEKRKATRALMLCIIAYFGAPHNAGEVSALNYYVNSVAMRVA